MKKLLLLIALCTLVYYTSAHALNKKDWKECANRAAIPVVIQSNNDNNTFNINMCAFYDKTMSDCANIINNSSDEEIQQIMAAYLLHGIIIPACGTPNEDN